MCQPSEECSKKDTCYRFKAEPSKWGQTYADFTENPDFNPKTNECRFYWAIVQDFN